MLSNRSKLGSMALALASIAILSPVVQAGPISEMITRHRMQRQAKATVITKPFAGKSMKDMSTANVNLKDKFKKRFALKKNDGPVFETFKPDAGVIKTSR